MCVSREVYCPPSLSALLAAGVPWDWPFPPILLLRGNYVGSPLASPHNVGVRVCIRNSAIGAIMNIHELTTGPNKIRWMNTVGMDVGRQAPSCHMCYIHI